MLLENGRECNMKCDLICSALNVISNETLFQSKAKTTPPFTKAAFELTVLQLIEQFPDLQEFLPVA